MTVPPIIPMGPFLRTALASPAFKAPAWMSRGFHFVGLLSSPLLVQTAGAPAGPVGPRLFNSWQKAPPFSDEKITQTAGRGHHSFRGRTDHEPLADVR